MKAILVYIVCFVVLLLGGCRHCPEASSNTSEAHHSVSRETLLPSDSGSLGAMPEQDSVRVGLMDTAGHLRIMRYWDQFIGLDERLIGARVGARWGLIDRYGQWVVEPICQDLKVLGQGSYGCLQVGGWGVLDSMGKGVLPFQYEDVQRVGCGLWGVRLGGRWGLVTGVRQYVQPLVWDGLGVCRHQVLPVRLGRLWAYLDLTTTRFRIPPAFVEAGPFEGGFAQVQVDTLWGVVDSSGAWAVPARYDYAGEVRHGKIVLCGRGQCGLWSLALHRWTLPPRWSELGDEQNGVAWFRKDSLVGVIDTSGKLRFSMVGDAVEAMPAGWWKVWRSVGDTLLRWWLVSPGGVAKFDGRLLVRSVGLDSVVDASQADLGQSLLMPAEGPRGLGWRSRLHLPEPQSDAPLSQEDFEGDEPVVQPRAENPNDGGFY